MCPCLTVELNMAGCNECQKRQSGSTSDYPGLPSLPSLQNKTSQRPVAQCCAPSRPHTFSNHSASTWVNAAGKSAANVEEKTKTTGCWTGFQQ